MKPLFVHLVSRCFCPALSRLWIVAGMAFTVMLSSSFAQTKILPPASAGAKKLLVPSRARIVPQRVHPSAVVDRRGMGGKVYSTGLEAVSVRILPKPPVDRDATYHSRIYVIADGKRRYIGHNRENKGVALGKLPAGEIQVVIATEHEGVTSTGPAARNPDKMPHAVARDIADGEVEVRFEGSIGLPEERLVHGSAQEQQHAREHHFGDVLLQFSGGVTADSTVLLLLESLQSKDPELRKAATEALRQSHPRIARSAGLLPGRASSR